MTTGNTPIRCQQRSKRRGEGIGVYGCCGFDTFGPFKLIGGIAKGHPTQREIDDTVGFYGRLAD